MPRDQRRSRERQTLSLREPHRGRRDCAKAKRACVVDAEAAGVTQRAVEVTQCLIGLTHKLGGLTLGSRLCWRGFRGANFPNICFRIERYYYQIIFSVE